ncbi:MAG TPA: type IV secretion protein Rhs, partial [Bacteroidia bacterium]|nr:type IV secretion protein Rhs [Bacteroidia bacterium]
YELLRDKKGYYIKDKSLNTYRFEGKSDLDPKLSLLTSVLSKAGYGNTFQYTSAGHLSAMQDSAGRKYKVQTDSEGKILEIAVEDNSRIDKWLKLIRYSYDADGNMTAATDALNQSQKFYYKDHLLVKETDRNGLSFYFEYDGFNSDARCIHTWGDGGIYDHKITYLEGLTIVENSLGHRTSYFHKGGLVYKTINALGGESFSEYNSFNDLIAETDEEGNTVSYTYDERSNQTGILTADGGQTSIQFNGDVPVFAMDASKGTWIWTYNEQNLLIQQLNPEGTVTRYEYENGLLSTITDYKGNKTRLQYDQQHNVSELVLSDGTRSTWEFDELGRNKEFIDGLGNRTVR